MSYSQALEEQLATLRALYAWHLKQPALPPDDQRRIEVLAGVLEDAEPYFWNADICDIIAVSSEALPIEDWLLMDDMPPTPAGFFFFSKPFQISEGLGFMDRLSGFAWERVGAKLGFFGLVREGGRLAPFVLGALSSEVSLNKILDDGEEDPYGQARASARILATCLTFIHQRIFVVPQQRAERSTRKRLEREGFTHEPLVRVVELRRKQARSEHHGDSEPVEWSHQWIVSGHWRQQFYPSLNANHSVWIMPYVKGPVDRPLKPPRAKVFAVVR